MVAVLTACLAAPVGAAPADRQTASVLFTTQEPGSSAGAVIAVDWRDPANPSGKPYAVARVTIALPEGATLDTGALPRCAASDVELYARGRAACPDASRLGGGMLVSDTGSTAGFPRFVENDVVNFNGDSEQVGVADARGFPPIPGLGRVVTRTRISGRTSSFEPPAAPGNPPPDNFTALKTLRLSGSPAGTSRRPYFRTPPSCPASERWITRITFTYRDGVTQSLEAPSPCRRTTGASCLSPRSPVGRRGIGRVRLGATRATRLALSAGQPLVRGQAVRYCVRSSRGEVIALADSRGRTELVLSTATGHGNHGVRPGRPASMLARAYPRRRRLASGLFRASPRGRQVVLVRRRRVRLVAAAGRRLLAEPGRLRAAIRRARP